MVRSVANVVVLASLPGLAWAQEATHTVSAGSTLWDIAAHFYGDPLQWTRLHEANRDRIGDPRRLPAGLVIRIPDGAPAAAATGVEVVPEGGRAAHPSEGGTSTAYAAARQEVPPRTIFYRENPIDVVGVGRSPAPWDVPPEQFHSAPWLIPHGTTPEHRGSVVRRAAAGGGGLPGSARTGGRVSVRLDGPAPAPGSRLQVFRVARTLPGAGQVVVPSGVLLVEAATPEGVTAVLEAQFERVLPGDLVRPLPPFTPLPLEALGPANDGPEPTVVAFAVDRTIHGPGAYAFLDRGAEAGVSIGDEYVVVSDGPAGGAGAVQGRVKVVAVLRDGATARIVDMANPVFVPGVRLRPDRRVR